MCRAVETKKKIVVLALVFILSSLSNYKTAMSSASAVSSSAGTAVANGSDFPDVDKLLEGNDDDKAKAKEILTEMMKKNPNDSEILWRLAKSYHATGNIEGAKGNAQRKKDLINEGLEFAQRALENSENSSNAHKWYAICVGARGQLLGTKEKIQDGVKFKEHIEKAIALNDSDPTLHNLLARFEFEVATLSSMERRIAGWLFAEVPKGTVENAIAGFEKSERLNPKPWKENRLLLAKCYIYQKNYATAVNWMDKALEIPPANSEEKQFDEEIKKLLKKYESYRKS